MRFVQTRMLSAAFVLSSAAGVAFVGCDAGAPMGPGAGGTVRLQPWQLAPEGAAPVLLGITDTVEGQGCAFLADSEGQLRCLPTSPPSLWSSAEFADASCTTPLYRLSLEDAAAFAGRPLTLPMPRTSCGVQRKVVGIARQVPDAAPRYQAYTGGCAETPPSRSPGEIGIVVSAVVAPSRYVPGTVVDGALLGGRVRERDIVTADGARFADHLVDERWGKPCTLRPVDDSAATCGVEELPEGGYFRDAACTQGGLVLVPPCADPPYLRAGSGAFALGPEWRGEVFEQIKLCQQVSVPARVSSEPGPVFHELGAPVDGEIVARATWKTEGAGRFATRGLRGDDGRLVALADAMRGEYPPAFHDNVTGEDCRAVATPTGDARCLPSSVRVGWAVGQVFADAACTKLVYFCDTGVCDGFEFVPADPGTYFVHASATRPAARLSVAVAVPDGPVYTDVGGACVASDLRTMFPSSIGAYTAGPDVPWDKYPRVPVTGAPPR